MEGRFKLRLLPNDFSKRNLFLEKSAFKGGHVFDIKIPGNYIYNDVKEFVGNAHWPLHCLQTISNKPLHSDATSPEE